MMFPVSEAACARSRRCGMVATMGGIFVLHTGKNNSRMLKTNWLRVQQLDALSSAHRAVMVMVPVPPTGWPLHYFQTMAIRAGKGTKIPPKRRAWRNADAIIQYTCAFARAL